MMVIIIINITVTATSMENAMDMPFAIQEMHSAMDLLATGSQKAAVLLKTTITDIILIMGVTAITVSYTHLDVYKRQVRRLLMTMVTE